MVATKYRNLSITLPESMLTLVDEAAKKEHRTRSELIRQAVRLYLAFPAEEVTEEERVEISYGQAEIARGDVITLDQLLNEMGTRPRAPRR